MISIAATVVAQLRHETGLAEEADGPLLGDVDHQGVFGLPPADERDHAVLAGRGVLLVALGAIDREAHGQTS
jgi:hypothetical protein